MFDKLLLDIEKACRKVLFEEYNKEGMVPDEEDCKFAINSISSFLKEKCGAREENFNINNSLNVASENNRIDCAKILLAMGADINHTDSTGNFPLIMVFKNRRKNNIEFIKLFLENGANIHQQNASGDTTLMRAAAYGYKDFIELLLARGANIDQENNSGDTALMIAAANGHEDVVELFLARGANIDQQNNFGDTALTKVVKFGHINIVEVLLNSKANLYQQNNSIDIALMEAVYSGNINITKLLLSRGANVNYSDQFGNTPLLIATRGFSKNTNIIELLLEKGANVFYENKVYSYSALKNAVLFKNEDNAKLLIEHILRINPETNLQELLDSSQSSDLAHDQEKIIIKLIQHVEEYRKALNNIADKIDPSMNNGGRLSSDISALADGKDGNPPTVPSASTQNTVVFPPSVSGNCPRENAH